jgi:hypothetical protein
MRAAPGRWALRRATSRLDIGPANQFEEARTSFERLLDYREALGADGVVPAAEARTSVAMWYRKLGRNEVARALLDRSVVDLSAKLGPEHRLTLDVRSTRAGLLFETGEGESGLAELVDVVAALRKILAPEDRSLLESIHTLAFLYYRLGRLMEAEPLVR